MAHLPARALNHHHNKSSEEEEGVSPGLDPIKPSLRHPNLIFLNSAVTASCLQGSFYLPPCRPSPPLPHLPRNHGGVGEGGCL